MSHQKRLSATERIPLGRKATKYLICPTPGTHKKIESIPLAIVLRDILEITHTNRETKKALNAGKILINGVPRKDHRLPIGFLDEISFTDIKDRYIVVYNQLGKFEIKKQDKPQSRAMRIIGKTCLSKGKTQINLFTGKNILVDKDASYKVGDSVILEKNKITKHLKFEKGAKVFLTAGKHIGNNGVIESIKESKNWSEPKKVMVKTSQGTFETPKEYAYIIDGEL
jgi:small subunit ribosomal protein S4e